MSTSLRESSHVGIDLALHHIPFVIGILSDRNPVYGDLAWDAGELVWRDSKLRSILAGADRRSRLGPHNLR